MPRYAGRSIVYTILIFSSLMNGFTLFMMNLGITLSLFMKEKYSFMKKGHLALQG